jgi:hypothetical protein
MNVNVIKQFSVYLKLQTSPPPNTHTQPMRKAVSKDKWKKNCAKDNAEEKEKNEDCFFLF